MSSDNDSSKSTGFSFEKTPTKIGIGGDSGKSGQENDFNFSDIPVLGGKGDKDKKPSFSFEQPKAAPPQPKEPGISSFEAMLRDQMDQQKGKGKAKTEREPEPAKEKPEKKSKWDKIASAGTPSTPMKGPAVAIIIAMVAIFFVIGSGVVGFLIFKPKAKIKVGGPVPVKAGGAKSEKEDPKAAELARHFQDLEKRLADAENARKESKFDDALKIYQGLMGESWREKEPLIYFAAGDCYESLSKDAEAVSNYTKCIEAGWKENTQPYLRIAKLLGKKNSHEESIKWLEKAREAFPADASIGPQLAIAYNLAGQNDKAVAEIKKANKSDLTLDTIKLFASILLKCNEKEQARETYVYGMKKFRDLDCFMANASLTDKLHDKIEIMLQAVNIVDENKRTPAIMRLAELQVQAGKKDEAAKILDQISIDKLKPESADDFLKLLVVCGVMAKFPEEYKKAQDLYPKDFAMHRGIADSLMDNGQDAVALDTYGTWWARCSKEEYVPGYLYARTLEAMAFRSAEPPAEDPIPVFVKVASLNPAFPEAHLELGYLYTMERNWPAAIQAYSDCLKSAPDNRNARKLLALVKVRAGKAEEAYGEYEKHLAAQKLSPEEAAAELIDIAMRIDKPTYAEKCLDALSKNPKYASEHKVQTMRFKLIYGKPDDNDFADSYPKAGRKFHEYYLLSKGRVNDVLLMTVPPDEFPDFWKLFLLWRSDKSGWQDGIEALIAKNRNVKDGVYRLIADIWSGKKTPDDARKLINRVHPDSETLFFLVLAEKYRKDKVDSKAKVCYLKAASERQNPLACVVDYYSKVPITPAAAPAATPAKPAR